MILRLLSKRNLILHLLAWSSTFLIGVIVFSIYFPISIVFMHASLNISLLAILFYASGWVINQFYEKEEIFKIILFQLILFIAISYLRIYINIYLTNLYAEQDITVYLFSLFWQVTAMVMATSGFIIVLGISFAILRIRLKRERVTKKLLVAQQAAQLDFLKAQINPHFLFNALNNIYSLVELKSADAPKMLLKLSDLLRYVIYDGRQKTVSLHKEIDHIRNFIALYQMRLEHKADITFDVEVENIEIEIEPMILIPIVENCFKHTDLEINEASFTRILLKAKDQLLVFETINTFQEKDNQKDQVGGVGLSNISQRLNLRYPNQHQFIHKIDSGKFHTSLSINL